MSNLKARSGLLPGLQAETTALKVAANRALEQMKILPEGTIEGLAEVVLRVRDLNRLQSFYSDTLGLTVLRRFDDDMVFFRLSDGPSERPQTLALFIERWPPNVPSAQWTGLQASVTTMHHFALSVSLPSLAKARELLKSAKIPVFERSFAWAGWQSLMIADPEENVVELVAFDPFLQQEGSAIPADRGQGTTLMARAAGLPRG